MGVEAPEVGADVGAEGGAEDPVSLSSSSVPRIESFTLRLVPRKNPEYSFRRAISRPDRSAIDMVGFGGSVVVGVDAPEAEEASEAAVDAKMLIVSDVSGVVGHVKRKEGSKCWPRPDSSTL